ncbi:MAG: hypothetical protein ACOYOT_12750 [Bacteroidales bacterium]
MKKIILVFAYLIICSCGKLQCLAQNSGAKVAIEEFYTGYCRILENRPRFLPANLLYERIDSLAQKYCTKRIRNEAKEYFADGHDLYTNDYGIISESLKSLSIKVDVHKNNKFIVNYYTINYDANRNPVKQKVFLFISVIKVKDKYRINDVR